MTGTILNIITVLIGSFVGLFLRTKMPEQYKSILLQVIGMLTLVIGMQMALKTDEILVVMMALICGALLGQFLRIDNKIENMADTLKNRLAKKNDLYFSEGFITASIIFCVGPMTILGSISDGLHGDYELLAIKSVLDGFTSVALSATFGIGVIFSVFTILLIQGGISITASFSDQFLSESMITEMTATGGIIILGIGLVILKIKEIKVSNLLPALILAPLFVFLVSLFQ